MSETAQELRDQAAVLLARSVALDRAAGVAQKDDEVREFARALFAKEEGE